MLPSPVITPSTTPFSVKDILRQELQQQTQQHQLLISRPGFSNSQHSQLGCALQTYFLPHSPPACMLAGRDSPSPGSEQSESEDRMSSYLSTLEIQERLAQSGLPREMFTSTVPGGHEANITRGAEREDLHSSKLLLYHRILLKNVRHVAGHPTLLYRLILEVLTHFRFYANAMQPM